jgi:pimeloyl-ACP methyl ester carboxylesterase
MTTRALGCLLAAVAWAVPLTVDAQESRATEATAARLKDEMRTPWSRSHERFIRRWLVLGDIPLAGETAGKTQVTGHALDHDWLAEHGGEARIRPTVGMRHRLPGGAAVSWRAVTAWGDSTDVANGPGLKRDLVAYAFATVTRPRAGTARLCIGSDESIRVWVNGTLVLDTRSTRPLTFDEDQVDVEMEAGDNALLVKLEQRRGPWSFSARVLEAGAIPPRVQEIGPSLTEEPGHVLAVRTDSHSRHAAADAVSVKVVGAGGTVFAETRAARGQVVRFDSAGWPDGAYEIRCSTRRVNGLLYVTHLPWYKGDAIAAARQLVSAAARADTTTPEGMTVKMLGDMVVDRLGAAFASLTGNPWWAVHSPLMEFEEIRREGAGLPGREREHGFVRFAYRDDIDDSPQFCRTYLPVGYDRSKKWPLVVKLHGYNPENPTYVRWWSADSRHNMADVEYAGNQGVIYMEPHGRGNTTYLGLGDRDIVRVIELAKQHLRVDEDRIYLMGDSMGGWGTWHVATRHPELFAAIAPVYGGADYHSQLPEEALAKLSPLDRFLREKQSTWSNAEALMHLPILVHHGDADQAVDVEFSRYGVRMLQRWGYDVRYVELPGYAHEDLNVFPQIIDWFLQHRRRDPLRVRIRSAELQHASAYWAAVEQFESPREFAVVDAEIVAPNTIRVDSQNVLALRLSPDVRLVDPAKPVLVVWNGVSRHAPVEQGALTLHAPGYAPSAREKHSRVSGPISDVFNTPFVIVTGTASTDPAMNRMCERKADALVRFWHTWQRQPPRIVKDSELSEQDAARYSLILVGGADANLVARRLAGEVPLEVGPNHVRIAGRTVPAANARVQMIVQTR